MMILLFVEIAKDLVTNEEYWAFCDATGRDKGKTANGRPKQPVTNVSWYDAMDYACWKSEQDGIPWRLPLEEELKAAEGQIPEDADFSAWPLKELPDVGTHPETTNSLGHNDLVGVVYQWTMRPEDKAKYDIAWAEYADRKRKAEEKWMEELAWGHRVVMDEFIEALPLVEECPMYAIGDVNDFIPFPAEADLRIGDDGWRSVQPRPEHRMGGLTPAGENRQTWVWGSHITSYFPSGKKQSQCRSYPWAGRASVPHNGFRLAAEVETVQGNRGSYYWVNLSAEHGQVDQDWDYAYVAIDEIGMRLTVEGGK